MKKATLFKQILCFVLSCLFVLQLGVPSAFANTTQNGNESVTSVISEDKNYEALIDGILEKMILILMKMVYGSILHPVGTF